jgi:hypothetical protein
VRRLSEVTMLRLRTARRDCCGPDRSVTRSRVLEWKTRRALVGDSTGGKSGSRPPEEKTLARRGSERLKLLKASRTA